MIVGFEGQLGAGKTLGMTVFTWYFSLAAGTNVLSNLPLRQEAFARHRLKNPDFWLGYLAEYADFVDLAKRGGGIVAWDELHQSMDSRTWQRKTQIYWTEFAMYLRKINAPMFFTSQSVTNQVDVRIRQIVDGIVVCSRSSGQFTYRLFDAISGQHRKTWRFPRFFIQRFFSVFDSYRIVRPVRFPTTDRAYVDFLDKLQAAIEDSPAMKRRDIPLDDFFKVEAKPL